MNECTIKWLVLPNLVDGMKKCENESLFRQSPSTAVNGRYKPLFGAGIEPTFV